MVADEDALYRTAQKTNDFAENRPYNRNPIRMPSSGSA